MCGWTIDENRKISDRGKSIADLLAMPDGDEIEFEPVRLSGDLHRVPDFS
jgi:hypothetical protein